jgi:hypothetical protein
MKRQSVFNKRSFLFALGLALILLVASVTWALAQSDGVIYACVLKDGTLYIVPDADQCKKNETLLSWNIMGPQGNPGLACWDLNGDGLQDANEDINQDGFWDAADCKGPQGEQGVAGLNGLDGATGLQGPQGDPGPAGPAGPAGVAERPGFSLTILDSAEDVGRYNSITIGADGLPVISYSDYTNHDLKVAHCNDLACSSAALATLDSAGNVGAYTSITIGADGLPVISYCDTNNLKVAHCSDLACSSAALATLDSAGDVGYFTSITIGAEGLPVISYSDSTNNNLKVAHCSNTLCTPYVRRR